MYSALQPVFCCAPSHYTFTSQDITVFDDVKLGPSTFTWNADVHVYSTGASLKDQDRWKTHGEVHIVVVHHGKIIHWGYGITPRYELSTTVEAEGAKAKTQLPTVHLPIPDGDKTHCTEHLSHPPVFLS